MAQNARDELRDEIQKAVDAAVLQLQANMILALVGMANNGITSGRLTKRSVGKFEEILALNYLLLQYIFTNECFNNLGTVVQLFVNNTFDLASVIAYVPRLLVEDMPTQFVQILKLVRSNQLRVIPEDANEAIDNVLLFVRESEKSGIPNNLFGPITRVLPNLLSGIHEFLISIFENFFTLIGAAQYKKKY